MNRTQALAKLRPILGKKIAWREDDRALTGEDKETLESVLPSLQSKAATLKQAMQDRRKAVLDADPLYQQLRTDWTRAQDKADTTLGATCRDRITVGTADGFAFWVKASGDNWQEVVDKLTKKQ